jgi:hypothetical protein
MDNGGYSRCFDFVLRRSVGAGIYNQSAVKDALEEALSKHAGHAEESTLQGILSEIENLDIRRKEEPEK